jgi:hypothetical protein
VAVPRLYVRIFGNHKTHALSCLQQALKNFVGIEQAKAVWSAAILLNPKAAKPATR